jgi:hypothetical protein
LKLFEKELKASAKESKLPDAPLAQGKHCRWCKAQPICPLMNGAMEKANKIDLDNIDVRKLGLAIEQSYALETFIDKLRNLAHKAMEEGVDIPGCKLVQKRPSRKWVTDDEDEIVEKLFDTTGVLEDEEIERITKEMFKTEILSVAQMEKALKKVGMRVPEGLVKSVSSGTTLALESDPRPSVAANIQLAKALKKL